jgi:hypothetical protein
MSLVFSFFLSRGLWGLYKVPGRLTAISSKLPTDLGHSVVSACRMLVLVEGPKTLAIFHCPR